MHFVLAEPCELAPRTYGQIVVDGEKNMRLVSIVDGVTAGQSIVGYEVLAPF